MTQADRSGDVSRELTEVRTVRSRALNAIRSITAAEEFRQDHPEVTWFGEADPDSEDMKEVLQQVASMLDRWARG